MDESSDDTCSEIPMNAVLLCCLEQGLEPDVDSESDAGRALSGDPPWAI
jgi:hypothetical protein